MHLKFEIEWFSMNQMEMQLLQGLFHRLFFHNWNVYFVDSLMKERYIIVLNNELW